MSNCVEEAIIKSESVAADIKIEKPFLSSDDDITAGSQLTDYLEIKSEQPELLFDVNCVKEEPSVDLGVDFINEQNNEEHLLENAERTFNERSNDQNSKSDSLKKKIVKSAKNVKHRKLFTCYICNFRANRLNLKEHLKIHIEDGADIQYKCHVCSYKAPSNSLLRAHLYTHSDEKPHKCDECDYQAKYHCSLKIHKMRHNNETPFVCKYCDFKTVKKYNLTRHMLTHFACKPYKCDKCDYQTNRPYRIKIHNSMVHLNVKPYKCSVCTYECATCSQFTRHMKVHNNNNNNDNVKANSCRECDYQSTSANSLIIHMRTHQGIYSYQCQYCEYKANYSTAFKKHMMGHTGERPFKCQLCQYTSKAADHLRRHMLVHNKKKIIISENVYH